MAANDLQVAGTHYQTDGEQHWDRMWRLYGRGYFVGCITKYVERYHKKNGIEDLRKARHFLDKLIELEEAKDKQMAYEGLGLFPSANEVLGGAPTPMPKSNDPHVLMSDAERFEAEIGASRRREGAA